MCKLFEGIPSAKIDELFAHLAVREVKLKKGETFQVRLKNNGFRGYRFGAIGYIVL